MSHICGISAVLIGAVAVGLLGCEDSDDEGGDVLDACSEAAPTADGECPEGCMPVIGGYRDEQAECMRKSRVVACGRVLATPPTAHLGAIVRLCEDQRDYFVYEGFVNSERFCSPFGAARNGVCADLEGAGGTVPAAVGVREQP